MAEASTPEIDRKYKYAIQLLQEAFVEKNKETSDEVSKWKNQLQKQQKHSATLEAELQKANQKIQELETQIGDLSKENSKLIEMRNLVFEKYNLLKAHTVQLRQFKKNIIAMATDEEDLFNGNVKKEQINDDLDLDISEITGSPHGGRPGARFNDPHNKAFNPSVAEKANELYKEIKEVLPVIDFEAFAKNINLLNSRTLTVDQALQNIGNIIKDASLMARLHDLIQQAELESSSKDIL